MQLKKLRLVRVISAMLGAVTGTALVLALIPISLLAAVLLAVCGMALGLIIASFELTIRADARHRAALRRDLRAVDARVGRLEEHVTSSPTERYMDTDQLSALSAYQHQATILHRLAAAERALGITQASNPKTVTNEGKR